MGNKPGQETTCKFLRGGAGSAAMVGVEDFPEFGVGITGVDDFRMADRNVAVDFAVNQKNWDFGCGNGIFGRNFVHVKFVFQSGSEEGDFD